MKSKAVIIVSAAAIMGVALSSCKGRRADDTPNGETVDVVLEPTVVAEDTLTIDEVDGGQTEVGLGSDRGQTGVGLKSD